MSDDANIRFCLADLPLSLVADTFVLPYAVYVQNKYGNISVKEKNRNQGKS